MNHALNFEDLASMDEMSVLKIIEAAGLTDGEWAAALRGASPSAQQAVFARLPADRADRVRKAMNESGPMPIKQVEEAQAQVVDAFRRLTDDGTILFA